MMPNQQDPQLQQNLLPLAKAECTRAWRRYIKRLQALWDPACPAKWEWVCRDYIGTVRCMAEEIAERVRRGRSPSYSLQQPPILAGQAELLRWQLNLWDLRPYEKFDLSALSDYSVEEMVRFSRTMREFRDTARWLANLLGVVEKLTDDRRPAPAMVKDFEDILASLCRENGFPPGLLCESGAGNAAKIGWTSGGGMPIGLRWNR